MPGPDVVYAVGGFVAAGLAAFVGYAYAFAPPRDAVADATPPEVPPVDPPAVASPPADG